MTSNPFQKTSRLAIQAAAKEGQTILTDVSFTAPFKIMQPFPKPDGSLQVMLLAASAGIMEGDRQDFSFEIGSGARLEFLSQSYDKIHQMDEGMAKRDTRITVAPHGSFRFNPQPTIPFRDSAFENRMEIHLADETSVFQMSEIFSCGRYAHGEAFAYRFYHNLAEIRRGGVLIYRDNTRYEPALFDLAGLGMYEGYTHLLSLFLTRPEEPEAFQANVRSLLDSNSDIRGGITRLASGDFVVRALGFRAQRLEELKEEIFVLAL